MGHDVVGRLGEGTPFRVATSLTDSDPIANVAAWQSHAGEIRQRWCGTPVPRPANDRLKLRHRLPEHGDIEGDQIALRKSVPGVSTRTQAAIRPVRV